MNIRREYRILIAAIIIFSLLSIAAVNAAPKPPFKGKWAAIDLDGSNIKMIIAGGGRGVYRLKWKDDYWTICEGNPGIGKGVGVLDAVDPNIMHTDWVIRCPTLHQSYDYQFDAVYDAGTDTMEMQDVVWWRVGK